MKAFWGSPLGLNTSLNSNKGAVAPGWTIEAETIKKCNNAKKITISEKEKMEFKWGLFSFFLIQSPIYILIVPMVFFVISALGSRIRRSQTGCGPKVARLKAVCIGSGLVPTISIIALSSVNSLQKTLLFLEFLFGFLHAWLNVDWCFCTAGAATKADVPDEAKIEATRDATKAVSLIARCNAIMVVLLMIMVDCTSRKKPASSQHIKSNLLLCDRSRIGWTSSSQPLIRHSRTQKKMAKKWLLVWTTYFLFPSVPFLRLRSKAFVCS